jgi:hypothetical protein
MASVDENLLKRKIEHRLFPFYHLRLESPKNSNNGLILEEMDSKVYATLNNTGWMADGVMGHLMSPCCIYTSQFK